MKIKVSIVDAIIRVTSSPYSVDVPAPQFGPLPPQAVTVCSMQDRRQNTYIPIRCFDTVSGICNIKKIAIMAIHIPSTLEHVVRTHMLVA